MSKELDFHAELISIAIGYIGIFILKENLNDRNPNEVKDLLRATREINKKVIDIQEKYPKELYEIFKKLEQ